MTASKLKTTLILLISFFVISCANLQESTDAKAKPEASKAYLAGSFLNSYRESFARLALEVKCKLEAKPLHIELDQPEDHQGLELFAIAPGECQIKGLGRMGGVGDLADVAPFYNEELSKSFVVEAGTIYYIGHYDGMTTNDVTSAGAFGGFAWVSANKSQAVKVAGWDNSKIESEISVNYPNFSGLQVVSVFDFSKDEQ